MQEMPDEQKMLIKPLTALAFTPFGDVLQVADDKEHFPINDGYTQRYHDLANIDVADENGRAIVSIFRSTPLALPIKIEMMERHPLGSQAFMPLSQQPYLIVVAPRGEFDQDNVEVFLAQPTQGVNYHKGTWHHFCLALNQDCDFLVIDRSGEGNNCDVETLHGGMVIEL
jgi:ureidoglycolate lyase